ncbi:ABC transporter transmembrane domain-containing protein [Lapillicoccus sp.]|uniref:ABC transporter transmembrane domain-containing protein n=1 Tax=Lapillicoccus sp. TaxID=1909287 RepID=UPI0039835796
MRDFPPTFTSFLPGADGEVATRPDTRSPGAFLRWHLGQQPGVIAAATVVGFLWQLPLTLGPFLVGKAVDEGILGGSSADLLRWAGLLGLVTVTGAVFGIAMHTLVVRSWLIALYGTIQMVARKSVQLGHVLPRRTPTGEAISVASSDSDEFGALTEITARAGSQLMACLVVAAIVLNTSLAIGLLVLVAAPVIVGAALPLLRPLHRRQEVERSRSSELTSMATDIVAGLRILRGIGGERTFGRNYAEQSQRTRRAGVSAGLWQAAIEATGVLLSGGFLVLLMWAGTRQVLTGDISVGQLISFLGYGLFMVGPIRTFFEFAQKLTRALVSARKAIRLFEQTPPWREQTSPVPLPAGGDLVDEVTGFVAAAGLLTIVVSAVPEASAQLADRLGRYLTADVEPPAEQSVQELRGRAARGARAQRAAERARIAAADEVLASREWGVRLGDIDLGAARLADVRHRIVVSDTGSQLFAGTLQDAIDPHGRLTREEAEETIRVANAEDVYDALPGGWQGVLDERGRGLSGGQRQRVVLARVIGTDAGILVLVEPTSAVDAHTEARIAERVALHRRGRTTVVATVSPLWLHHADRVALLEGGRVAVVGAHDELLETNAAYRRVVARALDDPPEVDPEVDPRHREREPAVVRNRPPWEHHEHGEDSRA